MNDTVLPAPALDPELVPLAELVPPLDVSIGAVALRDMLEAMTAGWAPELSELVERSDHVVSTDPYVVVRVHRPADLRAPAACLFSIHGGGYVIGSYALDDPVLDRYCTMFGCVGVSVEYRLAPETPYPGPLEDCYRGLLWTFEHAASLGIDPQRIGVGGQSAGGGLAAALALLARDRGEVSIAFADLECPTTARPRCRAATKGCSCGRVKRTNSGGARTSATATAVRTCRCTRPRRGPRISRACRPRS